MTRPPHQPQDPQQPHDPQQPGQPAPHSPAPGQPQPSAGDPYAQPYGGQPAGGTHYGTQSASGWGSAPAAAQPGSERDTTGFLGALFDLKFDHYVSVRWARIIYVLHIIACVGMWLLLIGWSVFFGIIFGLAMGVSVFGESSFNPLPLILAILFGWIPALMQLVYGRMVLEFIVASIKTAENTRKIAEDTLSLSRR